MQGVIKGCLIYSAAAAMVVVAILVAAGRLVKDSIEMFEAMDE